MKIRYSILIGLLMAGMCQTWAFAAPPFSFEEIRQKELPPGPLFWLKMSDGIDLSYRYEAPAARAAAVLIFVHGGGAYSGAGYQNLAVGLSTKFRTAVYLPDLRGHGNSGGPRGDAPTVERVWEDLKSLVETARQRHPGLPVYLGGHSSGGGLVLNYSAWEKRAEVDGYIFLAPEFGFKSGTARHAKNPFAEVRTEVFIAAAASGGRLYGNTPAVYFNYPAEVLAARPLMLKSITRNMSVALTPQKPQEQFAQLNKPFGLFAGQNDELFLPEKILAYGQYPVEAIRQKSVSTIVPEAKHLSILIQADELIGGVIVKWGGK